MLSRRGRGPPANASGLVTHRDSLTSRFVLTNQVGLQRYLRRLEENEIDLEAFALCSHADFVEMGIPAGPRLKIIRGLAQVSQNGSLLSRRGCS
eukprot:COSAG01_NODE_1888_length_8979_cov_78.343806_12_plen_94_part_00